MWIPKWRLLRVFLFTLICGVVVLYTVLDFHESFRSDEIPKNLFHAKDGILDDILSATEQPDGTKSIFFIITKSSGKSVSLTTRQACAIESAAFFNPNQSIFVLFTSPVGFSTQTQSSMLTVLRSYANVHFMNLNVGELVMGTLVEEFYRSGKLFTSKYFAPNYSDFLRFLVLYKYGGIYLDADAIVQRNLDELPINFVGKEAHDGNIITSINGAVMGFRDQIGHEILELFLKDYVQNYRPNVWAYNGPALITRVLKYQICKTSLAEMTPEKCRGLVVFPPNEFFPVNFDDFEQLNDAAYTETVLEASKNSPVVHLYNTDRCGHTYAKSEPKTSYEIIFEKNCPNVYAVSGDYI